MRGFGLFGVILSEFFKQGNRINKRKIPLFDPISQTFNVPLFGLTTVGETPQALFPKILIPLFGVITVLTR